MAIFTKQDGVAAFGECIGTTLFLLLALGGAKTAQITRTAAQTNTTMPSPLDNQTIQFISLSFGISLLVTAWVFYRVTGGLFNPAITLALWLIGGVKAVRACLLVVAQLLGGIFAAGLVAALTPNGGVASVQTTLGPGVNTAQGLFIEVSTLHSIEIDTSILTLSLFSPLQAFLTCILVLTVIFLATEKHKSTYLAPVGIGLTLMTCHLFGVVWTGCGINPARAFGPSVISLSFVSP
jgi:aquaporin related protein